MIFFSLRHGWVHERGHALLGGQWLKAGVCMSLLDSLGQERCTIYRKRYSHGKIGVVLGRFACKSQRRLGKKAKVLGFDHLVQLQLVET